MHDCESDDRYSEATSSEGGIWELLKLKQEGVIFEASIGLNSAAYALKMINDIEQRIHLSDNSIDRNSIPMLDSVMIAGSWNLMDQVSIVLK